MEAIFSFEALTALMTLVFLEIILGIDNVIFISIVANKLPESGRAKAWRVGLLLALVIRAGMLFTISWIMEFNKPLLVLFDVPLSIRDLILSIGGLFLVYKSTMEISHEMGSTKPLVVQKARQSMLSVIIQIVIIDFVFSFDSILTAVGLSDVVFIMIAAVVISMGMMMFFLGAISEFIKRNHSIEMLALAFLILIGVILIMEGFHYDIPKAYIYFAVAFSFTIELLNIRKRKIHRFQEPVIANDREEALSTKNSNVVSGQN